MADQKVASPWEVQRHVAPPSDVGPPGDLGCGKPLIFAFSHRFCLSMAAQLLVSRSVFLSKTRCAVGALVRNGY
jgi:hypothetical protein